MAYEPFDLEEEVAGVLVRGRKAGKGRRKGGRPVSETLFAELRERLREGGEIPKGRRRPSGRRERAAVEDERGVPNVAALRAGFGLSQAKFAALLGISLATLRNWEQGRRVPEGRRGCCYGLRRGIRRPCSAR